MPRSCSAMERVSLVELRVLQRDADRGRDGLEEMEVVVVEIAADLVEDLDHAEDLSPGDERHAQGRTGPEAGLPVEIGVEMPGITVHPGR